MIKNCIELFKTGIWGSQNRVTFPWEEAMRAYVNIWHLAGEGWACDISRLRTWDWNGPHCLVFGAPIIPELVFIKRKCAKRVGSESTLFKWYS